MQVGRKIRDFFKKKKSWSDGYMVGKGTYGKPIVHSWGEPSTLKIGNGAVIGARAVVSKDVPPYSIVAGNPAVVVKKRFPDEDISALEKIQWWDWDDSKIKAAMHLLLNNKVKELESFSIDYDFKKSLLPT